jgi:hypothetical protein
MCEQHPKALVLDCISVREFNQNILFLCVFYFYAFILIFYQLYMPEKDCAGKGQQHIKRQTRPLVRERAPQKQDRNFQTAINMWSWAPDWARHQYLLYD